MKAKFQVGQRVRIARSTGHGRQYIGRTGVIVAVNTGREFHRYVVAYNPPDIGDNHFGPCRAAFAAWMLEPLTGEDAWAVDKVKQVTKVHVEPLVVRETECLPKGGC